MEETFLDDPALLELVLDEDLDDLIDVLVCGQDPVLNVGEKRKREFGAGSVPGKKGTNKTSIKSNLLQGIRIEIGLQLLISCTGNTSQKSPYTMRTISLVGTE
jgi:hypothetical protein